MTGIYRSSKTNKLEKYDSSFELTRFKALDESPLVESWTKNHNIKIRYKLGKRRKKYIPDILVKYKDGRVFIEEVKGYVWDKKKFAMKNLYAVSFCMSKGMTYRIIYSELLSTVS